MPQLDLQKSNQQILKVKELLEQNIPVYYLVFSGVKYYDFHILEFEQLIKYDKCQIQIVNQDYQYQILFFTSNDPFDKLYKICCKHTQYKLFGQTITVGNDVAQLIDNQIQFQSQKERQLLDKLSNNNRYIQLECFINNNKKLYEKRIDILNQIMEKLNYQKDYWHCNFNEQQPQMQLVIDCEPQTQRYIIGYNPIPSPVDFNKPLKDILEYKDCPVMRRFLQQYTLQKRPFIGPTSMDHQISFMMCNIGQVDENSIVYDPFCGTASILISAAALGAQTIGSDFDVRILMKQPTYKENFKYYNIMQPTIINSNIFDCPLAQSSVTQIITDPPYAVRAAQFSDTGKGEFRLSEILIQLYKIAIKTLQINGKLIFWLPVPTEYKFSIEDLPVSQVLQLVDQRIQYLNSKYSRRLVVLEKVIDQFEENIYWKKEQHCFENIRQLLGKK